MSNLIRLTSENQTALGLDSPWLVEVAVAIGELEPEFFTHDALNGEWVCNIYCGIPAVAYSIPYRHARPAHPHEIPVLEPLGEEGAVAKVVDSAWQMPIEAEGEVDGSECPMLQPTEAAGGGEELVPIAPGFMCEKCNHCGGTGRILQREFYALKDRSEEQGGDLWAADHEKQELTDDLTALRTQLAEMTKERDAANDNLRTWTAAANYWYVKCLMDRGQKVDPHSSSQWNDQAIREVAADRESLISERDGLRDVLRMVRRGLDDCWITTDEGEAAIKQLETALAAKGESKPSDKPAPSQGMEDKRRVFVSVGTRELEHDDFAEDPYGGMQTQWGSKIDCDGPTVCEVWRELDAEEVTALFQAKELSERLRGEIDSGIKSGEPTVCNHGFVDITPADWEQARQRITELEQQVAALTGERDAAVADRDRNRLLVVDYHDAVREMQEAVAASDKKWRDYRDTVEEMLTAAGVDFTDLDAAKTTMNTIGPKPSDYIRHKADEYFDVANAVRVADMAEVLAAFLDARPEQGVGEKIVAALEEGCRQLESGEPIKVSRLVRQDDGSIKRTTGYVSRSKSEDKRLTALGAEFTPSGLSKPEELEGNQPVPAPADDAPGQKQDEHFLVDGPYMVKILGEWLPCNWSTERGGWEVPGMDYLVHCCTAECDEIGERLVPASKLAAAEEGESLVAILNDVIDDRGGQIVELTRKLSALTAKLAAAEGEVARLNEAVIAKSFEVVGYKNDAIGAHATCNILQDRVDELTDRAEAAEAERDAARKEAEGLRALLERMRDLAARTPELQGREFVGLGVEVNNALAATQPGGAVSTVPSK